MVREVVISQAGIINISGSSPEVASKFTTDAGTAIPVANVIVLSGTALQGITTSGAGNVVTFTISDASEAQKGVLELSSDAESIAGVSSTVAVVPTSLKAKLGTQTLHGIILGSGDAFALDSTAEPSNGQLLIGSTGNYPVLGSLASAGGTVTITPGAGTINLEAAGVVPIQFDADVGSAVPALGILNLVGGDNITSTGAGNTVTLAVSGTTASCVQVGNVAGSLTSIGAGLTGELLIGATGGDPAFGTLAYGNFTFSNLTPATTRTLSVNNADGDVASTATIQISTPAGGGDSVLAWEVSGGAGPFYCMGVDNSDSDKWKFTNSSDPSSGDPLMTMTSAGLLTLWNDLDVPYGGTGVSSFTQYGVLVGNAGSDIQVTAAGATGTVLIGTNGANPSFSASPTVGQLTVDNIQIDGNTISSTAGALNLTPFAGSACVIDSTWSFDSNTVTLNTGTVNIITTTDGCINMGVGNTVTPTGAADAQIALGSTNTITQIYGVGIGYNNSTTSGGAGYSIGDNNVANGYTSAIGTTNNGGAYTYCCLFGRDNVAGNNNSYAIGRGNTAGDATGSGIATALGYSCQALGNYSIAMGFQSVVSADDDGGIAIGRQAAANTNDYNVAIGYLATSTGTYSTALGKSTTASGTSAVALGTSSTASHNNSFVFSDSTARSSSAANEVTFGAAGGFRIFGDLSLTSSSASGVTYARSGVAGVWQYQIGVNSFGFYDQTNAKYVWLANATDIKINSDKYDRNFSIFGTDTIAPFVIDAGTSTVEIRYNSAANYTRFTGSAITSKYDVNSNVIWNIENNNIESDGTFAAGAQIRIGSSTNNYLTITQGANGTDHTTTINNVASSGSGLHIKSNRHIVNQLGDDAGSFHWDIWNNSGSYQFALYSDGDMKMKGDLELVGAGKQIRIEGGAVTDFIGQLTLVAGTKTIANTNIAAADKIMLSRQSVNGSTAIGALTYSITPNTSFTVTSVQMASPGTTETNDVSIVDYFIVRQL